MESAKNIIHNSIKKIQNIITNNATHIVISNENYSVQYDAPNDVNFSIFTNNDAATNVKKSTTNIALEPIYIKYVTSRDSLEYVNRTDQIENTPFYNNINEMFNKYQYYEQSILLYNTTNIKNIQPIIPNIQEKYEIKKNSLQDVTSEMLYENMLKMKNYMIKKQYINNSIWLVSSFTYQLLQNVQLSMFNSKWQEKFYGLPIYVCNELKEDDLAVLINVPETYCVLTKPSYNMVNIDTNTLKHNDGYEIDITLYIGSYILNKESAVILKYLKDNR